MTTAACPRCGRIERLVMAYAGPMVCRDCRQRMRDEYDEYVTRLTSEDVEGWDE